MQLLAFDVHGMTWGGCTSSVQRALSKIDGVSHVEVTLDVDNVRASPAQIEAAISGLGYQATLNTSELRPSS